MSFYEFVKKEIGIFVFIKTLCKFYVVASLYFLPVYICLIFFGFHRSIKTDVAFLVGLVLCGGFASVLYIGSCWRLFRYEKR